MRVQLGICVVLLHVAEASFSISFWLGAWAVRVTTVTLSGNWTAGSADSLSSCPTILVPEGQNTQTAVPCLNTCKHLPTFHLWTLPMEHYTHSFKSLSSTFIEGSCMASLPSHVQGELPFSTTGCKQAGRRHAGKYSRGSEINFCCSFRDSTWIQGTLESHRRKRRAKSC